MPEAEVKREFWYWLIIKIYFVKKEYFSYIYLSLSLSYGCTLKHETTFPLCWHMMLQLLQKQINNSIMLSEDMGCSWIMHWLCSLFRGTIQRTSYVSSSFYSDLYVLDNRWYRTRIHVDVEKMQLILTGSSSGRFPLKNRTFPALPRPIKLDPN